jgi:hypothetical protein
LHVLPQPTKEIVILSAAARSLIASGGVEGPAVVFAVAVAFAFAFAF